MIAFLCHSAIVLVQNYMGKVLHSLLQRIYCSAQIFNSQPVEKIVTKYLMAEVLHLLVFKVRQQIPEIDADIRVMFAKSELASYVTADYIMSFLHYELADIFSLET